MNTPSAPIEIRALQVTDPALYDVAMARVSHEMALDRKALGLPPVTSRRTHACGCPEELPVVEAGDRSFCPRCSS